MARFGLRFKETLTREPATLKAEAMKKCKDRNDGAARDLEAGLG